MAYRKIVFPCGLTYETKGFNFIDTQEAFDETTIKKALSECPIHGKECPPKN